MQPDDETRTSARELLLRADRFIGMLVRSNLPDDHPVRREADELGAAISYRFVLESELGLGASGSLLFEAIESFAATDEPGADPVVADETGAAAFPAGGTAMFYGTGGAGKTTLIVDQIICWARGESWCEVLTPSHPLRVLVIENEGPRPPLRLKLRERLKASPGGTGGRVQVMTEPWQGFTFRDDVMRDALVEAVDEHDADVVVVGPLARIGMQGGGTQDDITDFMALVSKVQAAAERSPLVVIVHHENRAGQVSGAWKGAVDTLVHVQGEGHGRTRVFWQKVRWSSTLHATTLRLLWAPGETFTVEERPELTPETMAEALLDAAREVPGGSWRKIREHEGVKGNVTELAEVRDRLLADGLLINRAPREGHFSLWAADDPATPTLPGSEPRTALEPLSGGTPQREAVDGAVPRFHGLEGTAEQNHSNGRPGSALDELLRELEDAEPVVLDEAAGA